MVSLLLTVNIFYTLFYLLTLNRQTFAGFILKRQTPLKTTLGITCIMLYYYIYIIIIKSLFNSGHIHLQNSHYIAQANKNQPWNIIDIIITMIFAHNTELQNHALYTVQVQAISLRIFIVDLNSSSD